MAQLLAWSMKKSLGTNATSKAALKGHDFGPALLLPVWHESNYGFVVDNWIDGQGQCRHELQIIKHYLCR